MNTSRGLLGPKYAVGSLSLVLISAEGSGKAAARDSACTPTKNGTGASKTFYEEKKLGGKFPHKWMVRLNGFT